MNVYGKPGSRAIRQTGLLIAFIILSCIQAGAGVSPNKNEGFSGKVFLVSLGVNDYSRIKSFRSLSAAESDARKFRERLQKDSSIREVVAYSFDSRHSKNDVLAAFDDIAKLARPDDAFIFYCAVQAWKGEIFLSDSSTLNAGELFNKSQGVFATRQLFFLDACYGEQFTGNLKRALMLRPEESAIGNLNRIVLGVKGLAYELRDGGAFTSSYTKSPGIKIMNIFSKYHRLQVKLLNDLYDQLGQSMPNMTIDFFSEKDFYIAATGNRDSDTRSTISSTSTSPKTSAGKVRIRKGQTLSLLVGCKNFDNFSGLANTLNDAESMRNILDRKYGHTTILLKDPTFAEFRRMLLAIREDYEFDEGSQFLFFAATHGAKDEHGSGMMLFKDSRMDGGFLEKAYSLNSIKKAVSQLNAVNTLMLIDICHSGTMFDDGSCTRPNAMEIPVNSPVFTTKGPGSPAFKNFLNQETNIFIGSATDQEAADGKGDHSPFATVVLRFLEQAGTPVTDSYYLQQSIQQNVMKEGAISIPMFCTYASKDDGRFLFIQK